ncbi:unnamed protein product [Laminaria digitata]
MKHKAMSYPQAVDEIRKAQPTVHINPGFEAQLALYRDMGCRLPGTRDEEEDEPACVSEGTAVRAAAEIINGGPTNFRADATYRWFLFACGVKNGDQGRGGAATATAAATVGSSRAAVYRRRACRAPLFSEANVVDHMHPVVQAASDSVYASFSRHGGDGSSWLAARDAAAAAAAAISSSSSSSFPSSKFGARAPGSKTPRGGGKGARSRKFRTTGGDEISARVSTVVGLASPAGDRGCCTSVFTEVLGWVDVSEVCRGGVGGNPRERSGKILCPARNGRRGGGVELEAGMEALCQSKLGSWSLDGAACSCGRMVKPAVQFTRSRIELV